jgi:thiol-disulfide isomerase/thioredoxin
MKLLLVFALVAAFFCAFTNALKPGATKVGADELESHLLTTSIALIAFYSPDCGACQSFMPGFDDAAVKYEALLKNASAGTPRVAFVKVDLGTASEASTIIHKRYAITKFPSVRVVTGGTYALSSKLEDTSPDSAALLRLAVTAAERFDAAGNALKTRDDVTQALEKEVHKDRRVLLVAYWGKPEQITDSTDETKAAELECRKSFNSAMVSLLQHSFFAVYTTENREVSEDIAAKIKTNILLEGWAEHPDEVAHCSQIATLFVLKCAGADSTSTKCGTIAGAAIPMPSTVDLMLRALATHALPPGLIYEDATRSLLDLTWIDRTLPIAPPTVSLSGIPRKQRADPNVARNAVHDHLRFGRRTRPLLTYFTNVKNCGPQSKEAKQLAYIQRTLKKVGDENPNITIAIADDVEMNTVFMRMGFKRSHIRDEIVFGILDGGRRYSSLSLNFTRGYSADNARQFIAAFNAGTIPRYWKSSKASVFHEVRVQQDQPVRTGLRSLSAREFERALFRLDAAPTVEDRRALGGMEDLVLVFFGHQHCYQCKHLLKRWQTLAAVQVELNTLLEERHGADQVDVPSMFLEMPGRADVLESKVFGDDDTDKADDEVVDASATATNADQEALLRQRVLASLQATGKLSAGAQALRRVRLFAINTTENDPPTEHWNPELRSNAYPVIMAAHRVNRVAYSERTGEPSWDVTVHAPVHMDHRPFGEAGPSELDLLSFAKEQIKQSMRHGQRVVRG